MTNKASSTQPAGQEVEPSDLIAQHEAAMAALEAKHKADLQAQLAKWIMAQKMDTAVAGGHYGTIFELERRGLITTSVDPDGFVVWQPAESVDRSDKAHALHI